jgi:DNA-binding LytR/AlgR family response regulator
MLSARIPVDDQFFARQALSEILPRTTKDGRKISLAAHRGARPKRRLGQAIRAVTQYLLAVQAMSGRASVLSRRRLTQPTALPGNSGLYHLDFHGMIAKWRA